MPFDKEKITRIIMDITRYFRDLEHMNVRTVKDLQDPKLFYSVSMLLFSLVNRAIDLGDEIVTSKHLGLPEKYRDIFVLLEKEEIISSEMNKAFSQLIHARNLIAHEYQEFTPEEIYKGLRKVQTIKDFVLLVQKQVRHNSP